MPLILHLILLLPCLISVAFSVFAAWGFRKYPKPPLWVICFLLILGFGTFRLLMIFGSGFMVALLSTLSAVLCIVQALALSGRRWFGFGVRKSWGVSCLLVFPLVIWMDLRFSVFVVDVNGNHVEVDTKQIEMQAMPRDIFYYGYGNRLKKGVVYFGFCQWVQHKEKWVIFGNVISPEGKSLRREHISQQANWENWPLRITVDAIAPSPW